MLGDMHCARGRIIALKGSAFGPLRACGASLPTLGGLGAAHPCSGLHTCAQGRVTAPGGRVIRHHVAMLSAVPIVLRLSIPCAGENEHRAAAIAELHSGFLRSNRFFLQNRFVANAIFCAAVKYSCMNTVFSGRWLTALFLLETRPSAFALHVRPQVCAPGL